MNKMRKIAALLIMVLTMSLLTGCGGAFNLYRNGKAVVDKVRGEESEPAFDTAETVQTMLDTFQELTFDASAYTKAALDIIYKFDFTDYVAMGFGTEEEAAQLNEELLQEAMADMENDLEFGPEVAEDFVEVIMDVRKNAKYTVGEAEKQEDGSYVVSIVCEKMRVLGPASENMEDAVTAMLDELASSITSEEEFPTEQEVMDESIKVMIDCIEDAAKNITYEEPVTTTIRLQLIDGEYDISEDDLDKLEPLLFDDFEGEMFQ